ncbi:MAG: hypothetical protein OES26_14255 [Gammaproteobacteria bacterium]|nr:hypothetical protein [Gammaproteobacteria bacterium]
MYSSVRTQYLKPTFRWLHTIWAVIGGAATILLATSKGHPPGLIFVPVAVAIWAIGHALLWLSRKLANRGQIAADNSAATSKWPVALIILTCVCGVVFIGGVVGIILQLLFGRGSLGVLAIPLSIWLLSSLCFFGILLRHNWARLVAGGGFMAIAAVLLYEMAASHMRGYRNSEVEWTAVVAIFIVLMLIGLYVLRSASIKAFFARK